MSSFLYSKVTAWALIVIPLSLSISIESRICSDISLADSPPQYSINLSDKVDLPWSIWAMTEKFLIFFIKCCYFTANITNIGVSRTYYLLINRNWSNYPTSISIKVKSYFISRRKVFYRFFIRFNIKHLIFATFVLNHCY